MRYLLAPGRRNTLLGISSAVALLAACPALAQTAAPTNEVEEVTGAKAQTVQQFVEAHREMFSANYGTV